MGTDALLSAILSGVLSPSAQPSEFGHAAVTVADIEEVRSSVPTDMIFLPVGIPHIFALWSQGWLSVGLRGYSSATVHLTITRVTTSMLFVLRMVTRFWCSTLRIELCRKQVH